MALLLWMETAIDGGIGDWRAFKLRAFAKQMNAAIYLVEKEKRIYEILS